MYNTIYYAVFSIPFSLVLALGLALLLNQKLMGVRIFRTVFFLPSIVPMVAAAMLWLWILNPTFGLFNLLLEKIGIMGPAWLQNPSWCKPSLIIMSVWMGVGMPMVLFLAALQGVPEMLYDAARVDGATNWQIFLNVTIPMISPMIFFNLIFGIVGSFQIFTQAYLMAGSGAYGAAGGPLNALLFYNLYLYQNAFEFFSMGYASAQAWILVLIIFTLTLVQFKLASKWVYYEAGR